MAQTLIERAKQLPAELKTLFFSDEPMLSGEEAVLLYGLSEEKIASVTLPLGAIFVGDMRLNDYPAEIAAKAEVDDGTACGIAFEVNKRIFLKFTKQFPDAGMLQRDWEKRKKAPVMSEEEAKNKIQELEPWLQVEKEEVASVEMPTRAIVTIRLPLLQALSKYEQLGNQLITQERIKLKSQPESVRPSLLYWIKYYRDELGIGHHSTVERGNFLFRSENGKKLTPEERERVNLVLKSVEENSPVEVDTEQNVVIFPPFVPQGTPQAPPVPPLAPQKTAPQPRIIFQPSRSNLGVPPATPQGGGLTFTSNHVMPGEREEHRTATPVAAPARPARPNIPAQKANPFHIRPVSMGEKDK